jgi:hypothetical protein
VKLLLLTAKLAIPHASLDPLLIANESILTKPALLRYLLIFLQTTVGFTVSETVTVDVHVDVLPLRSVTVIVTVFAPIFAQVKLFGLTAKLAKPQPSLELLLTANESIVIVPLLFNRTVMFLQIATGATVSNTVTVDVRVAVFPFTSVTVIVTVFAPMFAQVKLLGLTAKLAIPHASLEPLSTASESMEAAPAPFNRMVIFLQITEGAVASAIVTVEVQVALLPLTSVTVNVTVFAPISEHVNAFGLTEREAIPHESVEWLSTSAPPIVILPVASNETDIFLQRATGAI